MPLPITHIVLADKVFDRYFAGRSQKEFFIGTSFPDIRHLAKISRRITHSFTGDIAGVQGIKNDFGAGLAFHDLIDRVSHEYFVETGLNQKINNAKYAFEVIKVLAEEMLYNRRSDWKIIASCFDDILPEEKGFGIDGQEIETWHGLLKKYFLDFPGKQSSCKPFGRLGFSKEALSEIEEAVLVSRDDKQVQSIITDLFDNAVGIIKKYQHRKRKF